MNAVRPGLWVSPCVRGFLLFSGRENDSTEESLLAALPAKPSNDASRCPKSSHVIYVLADFACPVHHRAGLMEMAAQPAA